MTVSEFKNEFLIHYNAIASQSAPGFDDYEISVYLTKAQLELVKNNYNPNGNKYKEGFENSEKRRTDLKELITSFTSTTIINSSLGISDKSTFFKIPNNVFLIIYENVLLELPCDFKKVQVVPKTHDEVTSELNNPFKRPSKNVVWRLDISKIGVNQVVELISNFKIKDYTLRYLKYPKPIIISDLNLLYPGENLSIDGFSTSQSCELHQELHREIIDRAVQIALRDYKPSNLESKIQLDTRNE